jgi:hypothetical protein
MTVYESMQKRLKDLQRERDDAHEIIAVLVSRAGGTATITDDDRTAVLNTIIETMQDIDGLRIRVRKL